jgi:adenylate kinase family enzyme
MFKNPHTFIFIGRSGSGKGTQVQLLKEHLLKDCKIPVAYIETGEQFRAFIKKENNYSSSLSREIAEKGGLQPEFLAVWNWASLLVEKMTKTEHLILDGTPRRLREAHVLDSALSFYQREMPLVIHLDVASDWAKKHLLERKRQDDDEAEIIERLKWFDTEVTPVFEMYERDRKYNYIKINGEQSVIDVHENIIKEFNKLYGYNN